MKLGTKRRLGITAIAAAVGLWLTFDRGARDQASSLVQGGLVALRLADPEASGVTLWCPMHPDIRRREPVPCPICNMALVVLKDGGAREPGVLRLTTRQVQQAGVRLGEARRRGLVREIEASGRLALDERRAATISSWASGRSRIERLHVNFTGDVVERGQTLAEIYSPALIVGIEELALATAARAELEGKGAERALESATALVRSARERLIRLGLGADQIEAFEREGLPENGPPTIAITAPLAGTVLRKLVEEGAYVNEGDPLLCIADLRRLWLLIDVYEHELPLVSVGQPLEFRIRSAPGQIFKGAVSFIDPVVQETARTVRLRCDIDNADGRLKPGMFARVTLRSPAADVLSVPESAVLQSGRRSVAIIAEGQGRFRPRVLRLGRRFLYPARREGPSPSEPGFDPDSRRYHEVLSGLEGGERVVSAGLFLLNAEAQLQGVLEKMAEAEEAAARAPELPAELRAAFDDALARSLAISAALVRDEPGAIPKQARAIARLMEDLIASADLEAPGLSDIAGGILAAARDLSGPGGARPALARQGFARLSRQIIAYVRDFAPAKVAGGELRLFECSMAEPFGYGLWLQREPAIANPYMGKSMPG